MKLFFDLQYFSTDFSSCHMMFLFNVTLNAFVLVLTYNLALIQSSAE